MHASAARYLRVMTYLFAQTAFDVASPTTVIVTLPLQLSDAVTPVVVWVGTIDEQVTVIGAGQLIVGGVLSRTVIVC